MEGCMVSADVLQEPLLVKTIQRNKDDLGYFFYKKTTDKVAKLN